MSKQEIPEEFFDKHPDSQLKISLHRIWEKIEEHWGTQQGADYLDSLVIVEEGRSRHGFDFNIISELMSLGELHERTFPEFALPRLGGRNDFTYELADEGSDDI